MRELKDKLSLSMKKRKELLQQLARQSEESNTNEELTEKTKLCEKLSKEVIMVRHEMESGVIKFTQEIEEKRKAEDNLLKKNQKIASRWTGLSDILSLILKMPKIMKKNLRIKLSLSKEIFKQQMNIKRNSR